MVLPSRPFTPGSPLLPLNFKPTHLAFPPVFHCYHSSPGLGSIVHRSADAGGVSATRPAQARRSFWGRFCCCPSSSKALAKSTSVSRQQHAATQKPLLGAREARNEGKKLLALDLDETLVHSSFKPVDNADFIIPVEIENVVHRVYVLKRPGVDEFLKRMGKLYEIVVYTASLSKYADPLLDKLDIHNVIDWRLFREHCTFHQGHFVKDLSRLGRPLHESIIIDNSPMSYLFHPKHAIGIPTYIDDPTDHCLFDTTPFLEFLAGVGDIRKHMHKFDPQRPTFTFSL